MNGAAHVPIRSLAPSVTESNRAVHFVYTRVQRRASRQQGNLCIDGRLRRASPGLGFWHTPCLTAAVGGVKMATKILIVDDDERLAQALEQLLNLEGYQASIALSAEAALERFRTDTFHLVLSDLQLPGRNGISLIKALHEACPETKTVLITGHGSVRTAVTALKRGAVEYIAKPLKPRRLLALIHALTADPPEYLTNRLLDPHRLPTVALDRMVARSRLMQEV